MLGLGWVLFVVKVVQQSGDHPVIDLLGSMDHGMVGHAGGDGLHMATQRFAGDPFVHQGAGLVWRHAEDSSGGSRRPYIFEPVPLEWAGHHEQSSPALR